MICDQGSVIGDRGNCQRSLYHPWPPPLAAGELSSRHCRDLTQLEVWSIFYILDENLDLIEGLGL